MSGLASHFAASTRTRIDDLGRFSWSKHLKGHHHWQVMDCLLIILYYKYIYIINLCPVAVKWDDPLINSMFYREWSPFWLGWFGSPSSNDQSTSDWGARQEQSVKCNERAVYKKLGLPANSQAVPAVVGFGSRIKIEDSCLKNKKKWYHLVI